MISFIVPAHDEEQFLAATLASIRAAATSVGEPHELIVVDDTSSDATPEIARRHGARVVAVNLRQIARARNAGARVARGSMFIFVDADTIISPAVVRASVAALARGAVGGGALVRFTGPLPLYARLMARVLRWTMLATRMAAGCFMFCSRAAFEAAGGFDERLFVTEELALSRALGRQGRVMIVREEVETSGRKLRTHSGWELVRLAGAVARGGRGVFRGRDALALWYGPRRADPEP